MAWSSYGCVWMSLHTLVFCFVVLSMVLAWFADTWWESGNCQVFRVLKKLSSRTDKGRPNPEHFFPAFSATLIIDVITWILLSQTDWVLNVQKQVILNDNMLYLKTWHMGIKIAVCNTPMGAHAADKSQKELSQAKSQINFFIFFWRAKVIVHPKNTVIIYSPSNHSKPEWLRWRFISALDPIGFHCMDNEIVVWEIENEILMHVWKIT